MADGSRRASRHGPSADSGRAVSDCPINQSLTLRGPSQVAVDPARCSVLSSSRELMRGRGRPQCPKPQGSSPMRKRGAAANWGDGWMRRRALTCKTTCRRGEAYRAAGAGEGAGALSEKNHCSKLVAEGKVWRPGQNRARGKPGTVLYPSVQGDGNEGRTPGKRAPGVRLAMEDSRDSQLIGPRQCFVAVESTADAQIGNAAFAPGEVKENGQSRQTKGKGPLDMI